MLYPQHSVDSLNLIKLTLIDVDRILVYTRFFFADVFAVQLTVISVTLSFISQYRKEIFIGEARVINTMIQHNF